MRQFVKLKMLEGFIFHFQRSIRHFQLFWLLSPFVVRTEKSIFAQNFLKSYDSKLKGRVNVPCR